MFTDEQKQAVDHNEGPALVVASPGSGKSTVAVARALRLAEGGVNPAKILLTTFSSSAKDDLNKKLQEKSPGTKVAARTVHGLGLEIIKKHPDLAGKRKGVQVEGNGQYVIKKLLGPKHEKFNPKGMDWKDADLGYVVSAISLMKREYISPDQAEEFLLDEQAPYAPRIAQAYRLYESHLKYTNSVDFDDMLMLSSKILEENESVSDAWSRKYDYVTMDECQDSNLIQFTLVKHLGKRGNLMWIGDDFQSIYGFTGAIPQQAVYDFKLNYPNGKVFILPHNFRSQSRVVDISNKLVEHMYNPFEKEGRSTRGSGESIAISEFEEPSDEASAVVASILSKSNSEDYDWSKNAVIYRCNRQSRAIEDALMRNGVPYVIFGSISFYDRRVVKDLIAYVRLAFSVENTDDDFKRILNIPSTSFGRPTRYLGKVFVQKLEAEAKGKGLWATARTSHKVTSLQRKAINDLVGMVSKVIKATDLSEGLNWVLDNGYRAYVTKEYGEGDREGESRLETIDELLSTVNKYPSADAFLSFIDSVQKANEDKQKGDFNGVNLLSIHRSKGLEWDNVHLIGCHQGQLPFYGSGGLSVEDIDPQAQLEEERRLAYVAVTRAKDSLNLSYSKLDHKFKPTQPSQFLGEMGLSVC